MVKRLKKNLKNVNYVKTFIIGFVFVVVSGFIFSATQNIGAEGSGYSIPANGGQKRMVMSYTDTIIRNNCGYDIFIPTSTKMEFDYFIANRPDCLVRYNCNYVQYLNLNNQRVCPPAGASNVANTMLSANDVKMQYCLLDSSRVVTTPIVEPDFSAIEAGLKAEAESLRDQAEVDIAGLVDMIANPPGGKPLDDGAVIKLAYAQSIFPDGETALTNKAYGNAKTIFAEIIEVVYNAPYEGKTAADMVGEAGYNAELARNDLNGLLAEIGGVYINSAIQTKIDEAIFEAGMAESNYDDGVFYMNEADETKAVQNFRNSIKNSGNVEILIPEIRGMIIVEAQTLYDQASADVIDLIDTANSTDTSSSIDDSIANLEADLVVVGTKINSGLYVDSISLSESIIAKVPIIEQAIIDYNADRSGRGN